MPNAEGLHGRATDDVYDRAGFGATVPRGPRPALPARINSACLGTE